MDQARSTITKIFNGEPRSYTRFNLTQNMEGENSQVEMKLSSNMDEEAGNSTGEHFSNNCNQNHKKQEQHPWRLQRSARNLCFLLIALLLIFLIGYLIGYLAYHKQDKEMPACASCVTAERTDGLLKVDPEPELDWNGIRTLMVEKFTFDRFDATLREFIRENHEAGTNGDESLATQVFSSFEKNDMSPWTDLHFVKLQGPPASGTNRVLFKEEVLTPRGYAAYSANGKVEGRLVYAHFGSDSDFNHLKDKGIDLTNSVVLLRAGKQSFAEKVASAAKQKVAAVLIYPDPANFRLQGDTELYGHVHLGTGDPYTPGFPSFNHTQFPPAQSLGLPNIPVQTISANAAARLFRRMGGQNVPSLWEEGRLQGVTYKLGGDNDTVIVEVNNNLMEKKIHNVFGVIKGFVDKDRYVVIGAQRDSWGPGFAKATVGTSVLVELARAISVMVKNDGFRPRRSIVFASWSAGEYGNVGATEWLEGYLSSLNLKAYAYINLDAPVRGDQTFMASASPLLNKLIAEAMKAVSSPLSSGGKKLYTDVAKTDFEAEVMRSMKTNDAAYPFVAFSGIPSVSFYFAGNQDADYQYFGTLEDTREKLDTIMMGRTSQFCVAAAQMAGHMALRLVHDHLLRLDVTKYNSKIRYYVSQINRLIQQQQQAGNVPKTLTVQWLMSASGSFSRASRDLIKDFETSDLSDVEMCRNINDRIMRVEHNLLSPYVSPKDTPFRHIILGYGSHTLSDLVDHLKAQSQGSADANMDRFRNQFALATWTIQGCANALSGEVWEIDNQV